MSPPIRQPLATFQVSSALPGVHTSDAVDAYFSADVETDGSIPGPFSMLSFGLVYAGSYDGINFRTPPKYDCTFYS